MAKMTKAQAKKRLQEAKAKITQVYLKQAMTGSGWVATNDLVAIEKILNKCINRIK
jgi:hypothetical protein|tara:strand:+ start:886 stop:1053 length:168 start_codon:yes stop_codon:yes gene_type:complete